MAELQKGRNVIPPFARLILRFSRRKWLRVTLQFSRRRWLRITALVLAIPAAALVFAAAYYYVSFAGLIDARLHGARQRVMPKVFARPLELRRGQALTGRQLVDQLNDLGYAQRTDAEMPGEFAVDDAVVSIRPRSTGMAGQLVRVMFRPPAPTARAAARRAPPRPADHVIGLEIGSKTSEKVML